MRGYRLTRESHRDWPKLFLGKSLPFNQGTYISLIMISFQEDRQRIAKDLAKSQAEEARLLGELDRLTAELTRVRAGIASLQAADQTFALAAGSSSAVSGNGDLSGVTIREAILAVLTEAKPQPVRTRDLDRILTERGKKVQGGVSADLTTLKQAGEVLNPRWGFWTVP